MILFLLIACLSASIFLYMQHPKFGKAATGHRLERIKNSPNYKDGSFQNLNPTPDLAEGVSFFSVMWKFLFNATPRLKPVDHIPYEKTDLHTLDPDDNTLVWFGHSSYFMQVDGKRILIDPVLSGSASPLSFTTRSFEGADSYKVEDIPPIDYLFITHDHWDHLDYETVKKLEPDVKQVICALGVGAHLEHWGYAPEKIVELDWNESIDLGQGFMTTAAPARHFSGRTFRRNQTLWTAYVLQTPSLRLFIGGDSGYDTHFAQIGAQFDGFDIAILENGQYNDDWRYIHTFPEEALQAAKDLGARRILPVHSGKFAIALHAWDEPLTRIVQAGAQADIPVLTPAIGQPVHLNDTAQVFRHWWEGLN